MKINGKNALARAFKVSRTTIENWCRGGCPSEFNGKEHEFELSKVIKWHEGKFLKTNKGGDAESLIKARAVIAHYKGLITELEYKERSGELVSSKDVTECSFEKARLLRDQLLNIPSRVSPILAAEKDSKKVHEILEKELRQCLEVFAEELKEEMEGKQNANCE
jgi:phage terminase Nu1 subunit (DNA packaging protein)